MTELEYVISIFEERLADFKGKRIVLHGSRYYAEAIIDNFSHVFNFIGIMSLDPLESDFYHGLKIIREKDLPALNIDTIILTERVKYAVEAFHSIRRLCRKCKINIYNMYGLNECLLHHEAEETERLNLENAKKICNPYDIISFEVVNTILCYPHNLSELLARKLFCDLISYLRAQGKKIKFILRKTYPAEMQIEELKEFDLVNNEVEEIIRCEGEDHSFRELREQNSEKRILHIGSRLAYDFILPRCYGIDTFRFIVGNESEEVISKRRHRQNSFSFTPDLMEKIKNQIISKELISFDIFDTLLVRKTLYPRDVFCLIEQRALLAGYAVKGFADARVKAEENQTNCNIYQIYDWLQDYFGWDSFLNQEMLAMELEAERELLIPRLEVIELFNFARRNGKRIILTSDMYLPKAVLQGILLDKGILGYERIIVSCERKKTKQNGLYEDLIELCDVHNILHIGDNPMVDGIVCKTIGIDSILIPSVLEMAKCRGWRKIIQTTSSLAERCFLGLIISYIFRNPFQNQNYEEESTEKQFWRFAISIIAPLAVGHMTWLIQRIQDKKIEGVLFFARDGWLSFEIYKRIQKKLKLPKSVYYYANRKAASLCCIDNPQHLASITEQGIMAGVSTSDILTKIFQVPEQKLTLQIKDETPLLYIEKHLQHIKRNAADARTAYFNYSEKCGMDPGKTYGVVDFVTVGTVQKYLSQVLSFIMVGLYYCCYLPSALNDNDEYYLHGENPLLLKRYVALEPFFSSPEPAQKCMRKNGEPVFEEERRSVRELQELNYVWKLAKNFASEFFDLFYQEGQVISAKLIEELFATEDYFVPQPSMHNDWFDTPIRARCEEKKDDNND